jgi:hypothetical protein
MRSPVTEALADPDGVLSGLGVRYYLFGAQAALLYGSAWLSVDIDVKAMLATQVPRASLARLRETLSLLEQALERSDLIPELDRLLKG